jgi:hypothetical protein
VRLTARARANRRNAQRSTGPRTVSGKERVARNALKHGLAVPVMETSGADAWIEEMARAITGEGADSGRLEHARRVASAQLDIVRIREARQRLFDNPEARRKKINTQEMLQSAKSVLEWSELILAAPDGAFDQNEHVIEVFRAFERLHSEMKGPPPSLEEGIGNLASQLLRLDRYERRATSRRKVAIRAFDAYCAAQEKGG